MQKSVYITTAIPYANAAPHVGFALEVVQADVLRRYFQLRGYDTLYLTGTDVHGAKMATTAAAAGEDPKTFSDKMSETFRGLKQALLLTNDDFIITSEERHVRAAQKMWQRCEKDIYKKSYEALYCVGCERYVTEKELVNGLCPNHKTKPELLAEENYFFRLSAYNDRIKKLIIDDKIRVRPESKKNEVLGLFEQGLEDISISRSKEKLSWGVPVPGDDSQVMYVWFDALTNYLTGVHFEQEDEVYRQWWVDGRVIHVIGKDILRHHAALWPAMHLSAGVRPPSDIFVHGFITVEGQKMSKSLSNVLDPYYLSEKYGPDVLRYFLAREIPSDEDGDFSLERLEERYRSELQHDLGNLVSRVSKMIEQYGVVIDRAQQLPDTLAIDRAAVDVHMEAFAIHLALEKIWETVATANKYVDDHKPWELAKTKSGELSVVLSNLAVALVAIGKELSPYMPSAGEKIVKIFSQNFITATQPMFPPLTPNPACRQASPNP